MVLMSPSMPMQAAWIFAVDSVFRQAAWIFALALSGCVAKAFFSGMKKQSLQGCIHGVFCNTTREGIKQESKQLDGKLNPQQKPKQLERNLNTQLKPKQLSKNPNTQPKGYTLIEILIVIVIISIVSCVATLTIHFNHNKQLETFAHQVVNQITLAEEEAMLHPEVLGIAITSHSLQFFTYQEKTQTWQKTSEKLFKEKNFPDNAKVTIKIEDQEIPADGKPHLIIPPSGDIPEFHMYIGKNNEEPLYQIINDKNGNLYVQ